MSKGPPAADLGFIMELLGHKRTSPPASEDVKPDMAFPCATSDRQQSQILTAGCTETGANRATQASEGSE